MLIDQNQLAEIVSLIDLTSLNKADTQANIDQLLQKSVNHLGTVAAVCIYPEFISYVKPKLNPDIEIATVVNFPHGKASVDTVVIEVKNAIKLGANEIDLVIPYTEYLKNGASPHAINMVKAAKDLCQDHKLKVIIESGELPPELIQIISRDMINAKADFIKTSTGKTAVGATLEAAKIILQEIALSDRLVGFKASGGIRDYVGALKYIQLARSICGDHYINKQYFRFGVSGLLDNLLNFDSSISSY
ncbi:deoxyribose-phosphate aldolase [Cysteiniphilum sp. 6C5]|uniref:deoxyribose-phosphate aldolase n=1 Tax=unclassified Cysteiniphilum TaxID=2610889 RepID=UPI003F8302FC